MTLSRTRALTVAVALLTAPLALAPVLSPPAQALTVYDPWNYAQNMMSAARALEQINNQITSLQNEAQMFDQPGAQSRQPAALLPAADPAIGPAHPAITRTSAEHCLRCRPDRPGLPAALWQYPPLGLRY